MNDAQRIKECILYTALYYGRDITPPVLQMMTLDLSEHSADVVERAYSAYRRNGKNRLFPLPSQIIEIIEGGNSKTNANVIVTKLISAVKRHDYTWPRRLGVNAYKGGSFKAEFLAELGEEAWHVVDMHGGWNHFCESYWNSNNETAFKAQVRDLAESVVEKKKAGELPAPRESLKLDGGKDFQEEAARRGISLLLGAGDAS